jgi:hypothetical protein
LWLHNPALLAPAAALTLSVGVGAVQRIGKHATRPSSADFEPQNVQINGAPQWLPTLSLAGKIPGSTLSAGMSFGRMAARAERFFDETSPLRYGFTSRALNQQHLTFAVSWSTLGGRLAVGAGFALERWSLKYSRTVWAEPPTTSSRPYEDVTWDMDLAFRLQDKWVPTGDLGLWVRPIDGLEVAVTSGWSSPVDLRGHYSVTPPSGNPAMIVGTRTAAAQARLARPWTLSGAVAVRVGDFRLLSALRFERWAQRALTATCTPINLETDSGGLQTTAFAQVPLDVAPPAHSLALSAGMEWNIWKQDIFVRFGVSTRSPLGDTETARRRLMPESHFRLAAGLTLPLNHIRLHAAYSAGWHTSVHGAAGLQNPFNAASRFGPSLRRRILEHFLVFAVDIAIR